jgi:type I restriction enzyme S subunit
MKAGWKKVKLADVAEMRPPKSEVKQKGIKPTDEVGFLPMEDLTQFQKQAKALKTRTMSEVSNSYTYFADGDVLMAKISPCFQNGKMGIATGLPNGVGYGSSEYFVFRPSKELSAEWLFYYLQDPSFRRHATGKFSGNVGQQRLPKELIEDLEIPLPPLAEQKRIVALLDEAFARIDEAKANTEACQESAKSIFSNYLEAAFQQNGPGWAEVAISELCDVKHGYAFDGADFSSDVPEGNPLIVTPGNFTEDGKLCFNSKNSKRLRPNPPAEFKFNIGDLVVVMTDLSSQMKILGKPAFVETDNLLHNQRIGKLVFSSERVDQRLVYFFMMTQRYLKNIKVTSTGTMVKHTAPKRITSNLISFPENRARQLEVIAKLDELRKETQCLAKTHEDKKRALIELKSSLLAQAFAGELTA